MGHRSRTYVTWPQYRPQGTPLGEEFSTERSRFFSQLSMCLTSYISSASIIPQEISWGQESYLHFNSPQHLVRSLMHILFIIDLKSSQGWTTDTYADRNVESSFLSINHFPFYLIEDDSTCFGMRFKLDYPIRSLLALELQNYIAISEAP